MKLKEPRKLSRQESPVTQLKLLWRNGVTEEDKDFWREQFESGRTRKEVRQELFEFYQIELKQDVQLARFCRWVEEEDLRKSVYEDVLNDREELAAQGIEPVQVREEVVRRMMERALARGDFKLGAVAAKLELENMKLALQSKRTQLQGERVEIAKQRMALQERKVLALEKLTKPRKPVDYSRPLTDEERKAIVDKVDEIMGIKSPTQPTEQAQPAEDEMEVVAEEVPAVREEPRETAEEFQQRKDEEEWVQWKKEKHFE